METAAEPRLPVIPVVVDASGLKCPLPVLLARRALARHTSITLVTTDPASVLDVPVFCAETGHAIVSQTRQGEALAFVIETRIALPSS